jgi:UDP-N-acetylmuramoyl-tripeptide--D-alanyl-D-alanine ligase
MKKTFFRILSFLTRYYIQKHTPYVIGITGSVGKTTCRMIVTQMLRRQFPSLIVDTSKKNFNSEIGLCFAILGINSYTPTIA